METVLFSSDDTQTTPLVNPIQEAPVVEESSPSHHDTGNKKGILGMLKSHFWVVFLSIVLTIVFTFPTVLHMNSLYMGDGGDNFEFTSYMKLAARNISQGQFPLAHTDFWRYPTGFDFARGFDSHITVLTGAIFTLLFGQPFAYNLTLFFLLTLNGIFSYLFFHKISHSKLIGVIGMITYGFSYYSIAKMAGHPNLVFTGGMAFFAYALLQIIEKTRLSQRDFFLLAASFILIALGSTAYVVMLLVFAPIFLFASYVCFKDLFYNTLHKLAHYWQIAVIPLICMVAILVTIYFPHIEALAAHSIHFPDRKESQAPFQPQLIDYVIPNQYVKLWINHILPSSSTLSIEKVVFVGWIELLLFVLFLVFGLIKRMRPSHPAESTHNSLGKISPKRLTIFVFLCALLPWILSLGYGDPNKFSLLPYHALVNVFPFSVVVETGRYVVLYEFFVALAMVLVLKPLQNTKKGMVIFSAVIALLVLQRLPYTFYSSTFDNTDAYIQVVKKQPQGAVLDIPVTIDYRIYNLLSFEYDKPIVNGYFHFLADGKQEQSFILDNLFTRYWCSITDDPKKILADPKWEQDQDTILLKLLQGTNINTVVVHKDYVFYHPVCTNVRTRLSQLIPNIYTLDTTSDSQQKKITGKAEEGKPSFTLFFPYSGTFYMDGAYLAPTKPTPFQVTYNYVPLSGDYTWKDSPAGGVTLDPEYTIAVPVAAGSHITIASEDVIPHTEFSLWYRYVKDPNDPSKVTYTPPLEKIYDDEKATVYRVN